MFAAGKSANASKPLPVFVSSTTARVNLNVALAVNAPSGIQAGDFLVFVAYVNGNTTVTTPPTGWTASINSSTATPANMGIAVFTKVATASEPTSYTFTYGANNAKTGAILAYRNANAINVAGTPNYAANTATATASSITPTKTGTLVSLFGGNDTFSIFTAPSGMTLRSSQNANSPSLYVYDQTPVGSGATGTKSLVTAASSNKGSVSVQVVNV